MILFDHYGGNVAILQMNFFEKSNLRSAEESTFLVESAWTMHHDMHNFDDNIKHAVGHGHLVIIFIHFIWTFCIVTLSSNWFRIFFSW